jgi:hypothetical protein
VRTPPRIAFANSFHREARIRHGVVEAMKAMRRRIALPKRSARNSWRPREKTKLELLRRRMEFTRNKIAPGFFHGAIPFENYETRNQA